MKKVMLIILAGFILALTISTVVAHGLTASTAASEIIFVSVNPPIISSPPYKAILL